MQLNDIMCNSICVPGISQVICYLFESNGTLDKNVRLGVFRVYSSTVLSLTLFVFYPLRDLYRGSMQRKASKKQEIAGRSGI